MVREGEEEGERRERLGTPLEAVKSTAIVQCTSVL